MTPLLLATAVALTPLQRTRIDDVVAGVMRDARIAALSLGIARRGRTLYLRGYGLRDVETRQTADGFTIYRVGSIAKQFTAAMVLAQAQRGRIGLDANAASYLPATAGLAGSVTVGQLLAQTGGIAAASGAGAVVMQHEPGTAWSYSNANYALLGEILQRVTATSFSATLRANVLVPLSLMSTGCDWPPAAQNVARGYEWNGDWVPAQIEPQPVRTCSAVGLASNASDLLTWLEGLRDGRVVSRAGFAAMTRSAAIGGIPVNYGYGFFVTHWFGYDVAEHPGYVEGFSSQDAIVLHDGLEVAVLTNANAVDLSPLTESIVAVLDPPAADLLAAIPGKPRNENLAITVNLRAALQTAGFAAYGTLQSLEFVRRAVEGDLTHDTYRATFSSGQWWANVAYRHDDAIASLALTPIP